MTGSDLRRLEHDSAAGGASDSETDRPADTDPPSEAVPTPDTDPPTETGPTAETDPPTEALPRAEPRPDESDDRPDEAPRVDLLPPLRAVVAAVLVVAGLAAAVVAGQVATAPVDAAGSIVSWPKAGAPPESTTAFLVPYRPAELHAEMPCAALREAQRRDGRTTVLATTTSDATRGLVVRGDEGTVRLLLGGRSLDLRLPEGDCALRVDVEASELRVTLGGREVVDRPYEAAPEVFAITTDLTGSSAEGLKLTARTPTWFDNAPTQEKSDLIAGQVRLVAVVLALLVVLTVLDRWRDEPAAGPTGRGLEGLRRLGAEAVGGLVAADLRALRALLRPRTWALAAIDAGVVGLLAWWVVVGPMTDDDGFATAIARNAADGGPLSNYYRWFNASEAPFTASQQILGLFLDAGIAPTTLRMPSLLAGVATWVLLTRGVLRPGLGDAGRSVGVRLLAAVAFACWWLPYDLGTRPEPLVALGTTGVLALVLRACSPRVRFRLAMLATAVGLAALTVTVAPSGLLTVVPFVLAAPRIGRVLCEGADPQWWARAGRTVAHVVACAGTAAIAVVVVFASQSWHGFVVATRIHQDFGPSQPWFAEWLRYGYLLGDDSWGSASKRLPVLVAIVLAVPALVLLVRRLRDDTTETVSERSTAAILLLGAAPAGLVVLAVTPSKWSHHFGSLAGFGAVSAVAVVVGLVRAAGTGDRPDPLRAVGAITAVGVAGAAALAFSGPNAWWGYANARIPWSTGPVTPFAGLGPWLVVAGVGGLVAIGLVAVLRAVGGRDRKPDPLTAACAAAPVATAVLAMAASVGVLVHSFAVAADPPPGTWSFGAQNTAAVSAPGSPAVCGVQDRVEVLTTVPGGPLVPERGSTAVLDGFADQGGFPTPPPARPGDEDDTRDGRFAWGSDDGGAATVGSLTSPWFVLPTPGPREELALSVAGRTTNGASITLEFERSDGSAPLGRRTVEEPPAPDRGYRGFASTPEEAGYQDRNRDLDDWRTVTVPGSGIPPGADRVRVLARDDRSDDRGWVAVTGPRLVRPTPLRAYLADRGPVVVDWAIAFAWPCLGDLATVRRGIAQAPGAIVTTPRSPDDPLEGARTVDDTVPGDVVPERWTLGTDALVTSTDTGASFAGARQAAALEEVDTRLVGDPGRVWGRLLVPDYRSLATDAYDVRTTTVRIPGSTGDPAPVRDPQTSSLDP